MAPIERITTDTSRSYAALCDYAAMGPGRSLEKLCERYRSDTSTVPTKRLTTLKDWSREDDWQNRVQVYDQALRADEDAARATIRAARRIALEEADWETGNALREATRAILSELPRFIRHTETEITQDGQLVKVITLALRAGPGELARAMEIASKIQRLSVGEATEHIQHEHEWIDSIAEALDRKLLSDMAGDEATRVPGESEQA